VTLVAQDRTITFMVI